MPDPVLSLETSHLSAALHTVLLLIVSYVTGSALLRVDPRKPRTLTEVALIFTAGTLGLIGVVSTVLLRRFNVHSLYPLLLIAWSIWRGLERPVDSPDTTAPRFCRRDGWALLIVLGVGLLFASYEHGWGELRKDRVILPWSDLGYFALLAQEVPKAGMASQWAAVFSEHTREAGVTGDSWYHWGPLWLTALSSRFASMSAINAMIYVVVPWLAFMLATAWGAVVQRVTGWNISRSVLMGLTVLIAVPMPARAMEKLLVGWFGVGVGGCHSHLGYGVMFSYMLEALIVTAALVAWFSRRRSLAWVLLFCAGISTPHNVAGICLAAGGLGIAALWRRDWIDLRMAAGIVLTLGSAWATCRFGFGVDLPKLDDSPMMISDWEAIMKASVLLLRDWGVAVLLSALLLPGLWFLIRSNDRTLRALGWMAALGIPASYAAYHFLLPTGDRGHFTTYVHLVVVNLAGIAGLCGLMAHGSGLLRKLAPRLLLAMLLLGVYEIVSDHSGFQRRWSRAGTLGELTKMKQLVQGRPLGYFAVVDRQWWISLNAPLGAVLESPILRVNSVYALDHLNEFASFYGAKAPYILMPQQKDEDEQAWSFRFMKKLGIRHLITTERDPLPESMKPHVKLLLQGQSLALYELADPA